MKSWIQELEAPGKIKKKASEKRFIFVYISDVNQTKGGNKMNHYNRLTLEERYQIQALKKSEISCRKIAEQLNRSEE